MPPSYKLPEPPAPREMLIKRWQLMAHLFSDIVAAHLADMRDDGRPRDVEIDRVLAYGFRWGIAQLRDGVRIEDPKFLKRMKRLLRDWYWFAFLPTNDEEQLAHEMREAHFDRFTLVKEAIVGVLADREARHAAGERVDDLEFWRTALDGCNWALRKLEREPFPDFKRVAAMMGDLMPSLDLSPAGKGDNGQAAEGQR